LLVFFCSIVCLQATMQHSSSQAPFFVQSEGTYSGANNYGGQNDIGGGCCSFPRSVFFWLGTFMFLASASYALALVAPLLYVVTIDGYQGQSNVGVFFGCGGNSDTSTDGCGYINFWTGTSGTTSKQDAWLQLGRLLQVLVPLTFLTQFLLLIGNWHQAFRSAENCRAHASWWLRGANIPFLIIIFLLSLGSIGAAVAEAQIFPDALGLVGGHAKPNWSFAMLITGSFFSLLSLLYTCMTSSKFPA